MASWWSPVARHRPDAGRHVAKVVAGRYRCVTRRRASPGKHAVRATPTRRSYTAAQSRYARAGRPAGRRPERHAAAAAAVHVELLDAPSLRGADGARLPLERKAAALIALLALEGARPRGDVAALLWPRCRWRRRATACASGCSGCSAPSGRELVLAGHELRLAADVRHDLDGIAERLAADPQARLRRSARRPRLRRLRGTRRMGRDGARALARTAPQRAGAACLAARGARRDRAGAALCRTARRRRAAARAHAPPRDAPALPARRPRRARWPPSTAAASC